MEQNIKKADKAEKVIFTKCALTPVGQTKGKMAENRLPAAPTSGVFSTHVNPSGAR